MDIVVTQVLNSCSAARMEKEKRALEDIRRKFSRTVRQKMEEKERQYG